MNLLRNLTGKIISKGGFIRDVSVLAGGTTLSQAIILIATPVITRLYTPEEMGILGVYTSFLTTILVISSLRYEIAIPLPEDDKDGFNLLALAVLINVGITILVVPLIALFGQPVASILSLQSLGSLFYLLPVGIFFAGLYKALYYWNVRKSKFGILSKTKFTQSFSMVGIQLAAFRLASLGLIIGQIIGRTAGFGTMVNDLFKNDRHLFSHVNRESLRRMAKRYSNLPVYSTWNGLFNTAGVQLPPVFFAALFSPAAAGIYTLTNRVLTLPLNLISNAVADVFFSSASDAYRKGKLKTTVISVYDLLVEIILPPAIVLMLTGPELFSFVFGKEWKEAGVLIQWFTPWMVFAFITSPLTRLFSILEREPMGAVFQGILLAVRVIFILGTYILTHDFILTASLFAIGSSMVLICILYWCISASQISIWLSIRIFIKKVPSAIMLASPAIIVNVLKIFNYSISVGLVFLSALLSILLIAVYYLRILKKRDF